MSDPINCSTSFIEIYYERHPWKVVGQFGFSGILIHSLYKPTNCLFYVFCKSFHRFCWNSVARVTQFLLLSILIGNKTYLLMAVNGNFYPVSSSVCFAEIQCWGIPLIFISLFIFLNMLSKLQRMPLVIFCCCFRLIQRMLATSEFRIFCFFICSLKK